MKVKRSFRPDAGTQALAASTLIALAAIVSASTPVVGEEPASECTIQQRLDRLEAVVHKLAESHKPCAGQSACSAQSACRGESACAVKSTCRTAASQEGSACKSASCCATVRKRPILQTKRLCDLQEQSARSLAAISNEVESKLNRARTAGQRLLAAERQVEALCKAYKHATVSSDEVRRAIDRRASAHANYARSVCQLADDCGYESALAHLVGAEQARRDLKELWGEMADRSETREKLERIANEHKMYETKVAYWTDVYRKVEVRKVYHYSHRGAGQKFHVEEPEPAGQASVCHDREASIEELHSPRTLADVLAARDEAARVAGLRHDEMKQVEKAARAMLAQFDEMQQREAEKIRQMETRQRKVLEEAGRRLAEVRAKKQDLDQALAAKREALARQIYTHTKNLGAQHKRAVELLRQRDEEMTHAITKASHEASGSKELVVANEMLAEARKAWRAAHERYQASGSEQDASQEAQARERYFELKAKTQEALERFLQNPAE